MNSKKYALWSKYSQNTKTESYLTIIIPNAQTEINASNKRL